MDKRNNLRSAFHREHCMMAMNLYRTYEHIICRLLPICFALLKRPSYMNSDITSVKYYAKSNDINKRY